ncbi:MAG: hypothetical protein K2P78_04175 [Gemmataceae bacterium]|nr:hypothetical protein [Gemmataceae bacterium]
MKARAAYHLECFTGEDVSITGTLAGPESLSGATMRFVGWDAEGNVVWDSAAGTGGATCTITDASARTYAAAVFADFDAGEYTWVVRRTDAGLRWVHVWGTLTVTGEPPDED